MKIVSNGKTLELPPCGPAGPDGNPIGTVISYMGIAAPKDYLVCDGAIYSVSEYSELAEFFRKQFGSTNYFGGDGASTFAVPDMRNLFLRGYHGESEEQLSGEIGVEQDATVHVWVEIDTAGTFTVGGPPNLLHITENCDTTSDIGGYNSYRRTGNSTASERPGHFTSRPVNMAVLYCIKAVESPDALIREDVYSTEEQRIGTWIDGKPIYSKTIYRVPTPISDLSNLLIADNVDTLVTQFGIIPALDSERRYLFPYENGTNVANAKLTSNGELLLGIGGSWANYSFYGTFKYTKTTDPEVST